MKNLMNLYSKLVALILIVSAHLAYAQGGVGPGAPEEFPPENPIDMYWFVLVAAAVIITAIVAKKYKKTIA